MSRRTKVILFGLLVLVLYLAAPMILDWRNPLRGSPEAITASLLEQTPPGSTRGEVLAWVDRNGLSRGGTHFNAEAVEHVVGQYVEMRFTVVVFAYWVFDPDGRL